MPGKKAMHNEPVPLKRRSCRSRTKVNYNETEAGKNTTAKDSDSESDFEEQVIHSRSKKSSSSDDDIPLQKLKSKKKNSVAKKEQCNISKQTSPFKNLIKTKTSILDLKESPVKNAIPKPNKSFSNLCRPNLSEDESSDSEDEDISLNIFRVSNGTENLVKDTKTSEEAVVKGNVKRSMLFSETDIDKPTKIIKIETLDEGVPINEVKPSLIEESSSDPSNQMEQDIIKVEEEILKPSLSSKLSHMKEVNETYEKKIELKNIKTEEKDNDIVMSEPAPKTLSSKLSKRKRIDSSTSSIKVKIEDEIKHEETKSQKSSERKIGTDLIDCDEEKGSIPLKKKKSYKKKNEEMDKSKSSKKKQTEKKKTVKGKTGDDLNNSIEIGSESGSESDDNWEDVDEKKVKTPKKSKKKKKSGSDEDEVDLNMKKPDITIKDIQISVGVESIHAAKKRKSKREKLHIWMRQLAYRIHKETQLLFHKCHLLCLLANAMNENKFCNDQILQGVCLSLIPNDYFKPSPSSWDVNHVRRFTTWFQNDVPATQELVMLIDKRAKHIEKLKRIHIYVIMLRMIGFPCRVIYSLLPCTSKVKRSDAPINIEEDVKKEEKDDQTKKEEKEDNMVTPAKKKSSTEKKNSKSSSHKKKKSLKKISSPYLSTEEDPDPDFSVTTGLKVPGSARQQRKSQKKDKTAVSPKEVAIGCNHWAEVYLETMNKWVCVELATLSINSPNKCEAAATQPLQYVIALDNEHKVKDVTCRYAEKWLTLNRKLRADREWWAQTIDPYKPKDDSRSTAEDAQMRSSLMQKDLPKTISALKDHPLYVIQRHLLKFQAIYPAEIVPVGFINKEPIFPRDSVYELHTKETWLKQARSVRPGEIPYKIVKGRPKFKERHLKQEIQSPIFGIWQTDEYVPPPVVDGKVPKNDYGNIELFKPTMLPEGAVHLPMANMKNIARKFDIDYAPAMMGWDFHSGFSHPIFEGIVVAKEYEDKLLDEWNKQEELREEKEKLKKEKAIYDNWKKLIKGLFIQARIKSRYSFEEEEEAVDTKKTAANKNKKGKPTEKPAVRKTNKKEAKKKEEVAKTEEDVEYTSTSQHWPQLKID